MRPIATLSDPGLARLVLHPLRRRILSEAAAGPVSGAEVARRTGEPRQKVSYHVGALAEAGLLEGVGERRRRGLTEKLYRASARHYAVTPEVLGDLAPPVEARSDAFSAGTLLALAGRMQTEVGRSARQAESTGKRLATLSLDTEVRFTSAAEQARFAAALAQAVADVASRFSEPAPGDSGHLYRVVLGAYPVPIEEEV